MQPTGMASEETSIMLGGGFAQTYRVKKKHLKGSSIVFLSIKKM